MIALNRLICANRMLELIYVSALDAGEHSALRHFKTSPELIQYAVILYVGFPLSLYNLEDLLLECPNPINSTIVS